MKIKSTTDNSSATSAAKSSGFATLLVASSSQKDGIASSSGTNADTDSFLSFKSTLKKLSSASGDAKKTLSSNKASSTSSAGSDEPLKSSSSENQGVSVKQKSSNVNFGTAQKLVNSEVSSAYNAFGTVSGQVKPVVNTATSKAVTGSASTAVKSSKKSLSDSVNGSSVVQSVSDSAITTLIASLLQVMNAPAAKLTASAGTSSFAGMAQTQTSAGGQNSAPATPLQQGLTLPATAQNTSAASASLMANAISTAGIQTSTSDGKSSFQKIDTASPKQSALAKNASSVVASGVDDTQKLSQADNQAGISLSSFSDPEIINPISITFTSGDTQNAQQVTSNVASVSAEVGSINLQEAQTNTDLKETIQSRVSDEGEPVSSREDDGRIAVPLVTDQARSQLDADEKERGEHSESPDKQALKENPVPSDLLASASVSEKNFASLLGLQSVGTEAQTPLAQLLGMVKSQTVSGATAPSAVQTAGDDSSLSMTIMMDNSTPVTVRMENTKGVTTSIVLESDNPEVVQHLTKNKHQLMEALGTAGLNAGAIKIDVVAPTQNTSNTADQQGGDGGQNFASGDSASSLLGGMSDSGSGQRGAGHAWGAGSVSGPHEVLEPNVVGANIPEAVWGRRGQGINITA